MELGLVVTNEFWRMVKHKLELTTLHGRMPVHVGVSVSLHNAVCHRHLMIIFAWFRMLQRMQTLLFLTRVCSFHYHHFFFSHFQQKEAREEKPFRQCQRINNYIDTRWRTNSKRRELAEELGSCVDTTLWYFSMEVTATYWADIWTRIL